MITSRTESKCWGRIAIMTGREREMENKRGILIGDWGEKLAGRSFLYQPICFLNPVSKFLALVTVDGFVRHSDSSSLFPSKMLNLDPEPNGNSQVSLTYLSQHPTENSIKSSTNLPFKSKVSCPEFQRNQYPSPKAELKHHISGQQMQISESIAQVWRFSARNCESGSHHQCGPAIWSS